MSDQRLCQENAQRRDTEEQVNNFFPQLGFDLLLLKPDAQIYQLANDVDVVTLDQNVELIEQNKVLVVIFDYVPDDFAQALQDLVISCCIVVKFDQDLDQLGQEFLDM